MGAENNGQFPTFQAKVASTYWEDGRLKTLGECYELKIQHPYDACLWKQAVQISSAAPLNPAPAAA